MKKLLSCLSAAIAAAGGAFAQNAEPAAAQAVTYPANVVAELGTGTWCGWCVMGLASFQYYIEAYSEPAPGRGRFIPIAVHKGDAISLLGYSSGLAIQNYPSMRLNRSADQFDPEDRDRVEQMLASASSWLAEIDEVTLNGQSGRMAFSIRCGHDQPGKALSYAIVITEDLLGPYRQQNYYYGMSAADKRKIPTWVMPYIEPYFTMGDPFIAYYDNVAQTIIPDFDGIEITADWQADTPVGFAADLFVPSYAQNKDNLNYILLVTDPADGAIVASDILKRESTSTIDPCDDLQAPPFALHGLSLELKPAVEHARLCTLSGATVYDGPACSLALKPATAYVLVADGKAFKIATTGQND